MNRFSILWRTAGETAAYPIHTSRVQLSRRSQPAWHFEENLTTEDEVFSDAPIAVSSDYTISCWLQKTGGYNHGDETLTKAFENSCNPIFTQLAYRIGVSKYYSYVRMLGFYDRTGIDLPAEGKGISILILRRSIWLFSHTASRLL